MRHHAWEDEDPECYNDVKVKYVKEGEGKKKELAKAKRLANKVFEIQAGGKRVSRGSWGLLRKRKC